MEGLGGGASGLAWGEQETLHSHPPGLEASWGRQKGLWGTVAWTLRGASLSSGIQMQKQGRATLQ